MRRDVRCLLLLLPCFPVLLFCFPVLLFVCSSSFLLFASRRRAELDAHSELRAGQEILIEKGRSADEHKKKRLDAKKELLSLVRELESERSRTRRTIGDAGETLSRIAVQVALVRNLQATVVEQLHALGILDPDAPEGSAGSARIGRPADRRAGRGGDGDDGDGAIFAPVNSECAVLVDEIGELSRLIALLSERGGDASTARCALSGCFSSLFSSKPIVPRARGCVARPVHFFCFSLCIRYFFCFPFLRVVRSRRSIAPTLRSVLSVLARRGRVAAA